LVREDEVVRLSRRWRGAAALLLVLLAVGALTTASVISERDRVEDGAGAGTAVNQRGPGAVPAGEQGSDGAGDPYYPTDGNGGYDVDGYQVSITYQPDGKHLDGDTTITARATMPLARFNLDLSGLTVHSIEVNGQPARFDRTGRHELVVTPETSVNAGAAFTTRVRYDGVPELFDEQGIGAGGWYADSSGAAFALGQPHSASAWYPANDTPRDKATFALTARVPDGWTVVSNGVDEPPTSADGWTTFRWRLDEPVATYLTTIAIDHFRVVRSQVGNGTPVIDAYAPGTDAVKPAEDRLPEIIDFLSGKFGAYPFEAAGGIFVRGETGYALEVQTRPVYSPQPGLTTIVHENAHQWFGDYVSVTNWADICLNECFASYAEWMWSEAKDGADLDRLYRQAVNRVRFGDLLYDMGAGREFTGVYSKGPVALHALRRQIGDAAFDQVLKGWPQRHRDGNATWPQFEAYVAEVSGQHLDGFFQAWFHSTTKPADQYLWPGSLRP
jgi:aminopeptidase N